MIPEDVEEFGAEVEKIFYKFLKAVAKPDGRYLCWYLPDIKGQEPDIRWNNQGQVSTRYPLCGEERLNKQNGCLLVTEKGTDLATRKVSRISARTVMKY
jgi:hypothetical protein